MSEQEECFGGMLPDLDRLEFNKPQAGKAFDVLAESHGIGVASRQMKVRAEAWDACTACESYDNCYDLSMPKLALATALGART